MTRHGQKGERLSEGARIDDSYCKPRVQCPSAVLLTSYGLSHSLRRGHPDADTVFQDAFLHDTREGPHFVEIVSTGHF